MTVQLVLCWTWSETPKTGFLTTRLISDVIERHYDVWNSKLFVQPSLTKCLLPLASHLKDKEVGFNKYLYTAVTVARCIEFLHDRDVSTVDLSLDNVYLKPASTVIIRLLISIVMIPRILSDKFLKTVKMYIRLFLYVC